MGKYVVTLTFAGAVEALHFAEREEAWEKFMGVGARPEVKGAAFEVAPVKSAWKGGALAIERARAAYLAA